MTIGNMKEEFDRHPSSRKKVEVQDLLVRFGVDDADFSIWLSFSR
jgi:hypothetical protein